MYVLICTNLMCMWLPCAPKGHCGLNADMLHNMQLDCIAAQHCYDGITVLVVLGGCVYARNATPGQQLRHRLVRGRSDLCSLQA